MDAVKDAVKTFIRTRRDDRIGLVVFSDNPYVISPLTFDHEYLLHYIDFVDDKLLQGEGQTAIGDGLALSDYVLSRQATPSSRGHQVVVLFTDGESNRGREPVDVLKEAKEAGIRVHVVLPGATATGFWSAAGTDLEHLPREIVMPVDDLVDAALAGFDQGELVTVPSLPDAADWEAYEAARRALLPGLSRATPAERYGAAPRRGASIPGAAA